MAYEVTDDEGRGSFSTVGKTTDYEFSERVLEEITKMGIREPPRPVYNKDHLKIYSNVSEGAYFDGRMPMTVRKLTLDQLSDIYGLFRAWFDYLLYKFSMWKTKYSEASAKATLKEAQLRKEAEEKGMKAQDQRTYATVDGEFVQLDTDREISKAVFDYVEAQVKITSKNLSLLSREITIREMKFEAESKFRGYNNTVMRYVRNTEVEDAGDEPVEDPGEEGAAPAAPSKARGVYTDYRAKRR